MKIKALIALSIIVLISIIAITQCTNYHGGGGGETGFLINSNPSGAQIYLWMSTPGGAIWICNGTEVTPHTFTGLVPSSYYKCFLYKDGYY